MARPTTEEVSSDAVVLEQQNSTFVPIDTESVCLSGCTYLLVKERQNGNEIGCIAVMSGPIVPNTPIPPHRVVPDPVNSGIIDTEKIQDEEERWTIAWIIRYILMILITVGSSVLSGLLGMGKNLFPCWLILCRQRYQFCSRFPLFDEIRFNHGYWYWCINYDWVNVFHVSLLFTGYVLG